MRARTFRLVAAGLALILAAAAVRAASSRRGFDHAVHDKLFPLACTTCHAGAAEPGAAVWPDRDKCAACHDGEVAPVVSWTAPLAPPPSNLRFAHDRHSSATADSVGCAQCHTTDGLRSEVHRNVVTQCIDCHQPGAEHLTVVDQQCATCHLPLAEAVALPAGQVRGFPAPPSHQAPEFGLSGHAKLASVRTPGGQPTVSASCATCHAQNFCLNCHVNAPEVAAIQALRPDERSLVHRAEFVAPPSHAARNFATAHGRQAQRNPASCATCHAQPSCAACHVAPAPRAVTALHQPAPGRAAGALLDRRPPASHTVEFRESHAGAATAAPRSCSSCHVREDCLACHRPDPGQPSGGNYHPAGFLTSHPSAAFARQTSCSDCHNTQQFCASCHAQAGLGASRSLGSARFHDGRASFILGHGQAARQSLESCVSCHTERDCTACHAAIGRGFRFNPHGPGFDPERLRRRNPEMCAACHGAAIPRSP